MERLHETDETWSRFGDFNTRHTELFWLFNKSIQSILCDLSKKGMIVVDSGGKTPKETRTTTKKTKTKTTTKRAHARSWLSHYKYNDSIIFMLISATLKVHFSRFVTNTSKPRPAPVFSACKVSVLKITQHASLPPLPHALHHSFSISFVSAYI